MQRYVFKDGPLTIKGSKDADPQKIGEALATIAELSGGDLRPAEVWKAAQGNPEHPCYPHFEWDIQKAAEAHWTDQARELIRCIRVDEDDGNSDPERAFLSISDKRGVSYRTLGDIRTSGYLQERLLAAAERDLDAFTVRYRAIKDLCAIVEMAKKVAKAKRSNNETREAA
jgi:hypothetical protein